MQLAISSTKMKSLFKGLRYISQVFESEKEPEMQIGNPTNVKHVAHIGWDGPADNSTAPSWMNEFKCTPGMESTLGCEEDDSSVKCKSEYGGRSKDLPKLPKSTRKSASEKGSPTKEKSDKTKRRTSNKDTISSRKSKETLGHDDDSSSIQHNVGLSKKSRQKKSKEGNGKSSITSQKSEFDQVSDVGSVRSMSQFDRDIDGF